MNNEKTTSSPLLKIQKAAGSDAGKAVIALCLILILGCVFNANGAFFKIATHRDALRAMSVYGMMAVGMTMVILTGGIDLTQGSIVGFSAVLFSILTIHNGMNSLLAMAIVIAACTCFGFVSGTLISRFKLQPFIATLAMQSLIRGLARAITNNTKISTYKVLEDGTTAKLTLPGIFSVLDRKILGGNLTVVTVIMAFLIFLAWVMLSRQKWGRDIYAIGGNEEAARLSGINVVNVKTTVYMVSSMLCAIAGICLAAQERQGDPAAGVGYETQAICMTVIGGTSMAGGRGGVYLTCIGILTIGYLQKVLSINAIPEAWRLVITGAILIVAVLAQSSNKR